MTAYSVFDDFPQDAVDILTAAGIRVTLHPQGMPRPAGEELKALLEKYDVLIISTAQVLTEEMFAAVSSPKIIGTASIGIDHIHVPEGKKDLITICNAPEANRISVAEHTFALILALKKHLTQGRRTATQGKSKKAMDFSPTDLQGSRLGVVGAGGTAGAVLRLARAFGLECCCWTAHPERHRDLDWVEFVPLDTLMAQADILSVNLPLTSQTRGLIGRKQIARMKDDAIFISLSRAEITDNEALFQKARECPAFRVGLDMDAPKVAGLWDETMDNVIVTPHIGGGTVQARKRMFREVGSRIADFLRK